MSFFYIINLIKLKLYIVIDCPSYTITSVYSWVMFLDNIESILGITLTYHAADLLELVKVGIDGSLGSLSVWTTSAWMLVSLEIDIQYAVTEMVKFKVKIDPVKTK